MKENKTNHEIYRDELLSNPELVKKYDLSREKIKLEMMLETLRTQVLADKSRKTILGQITRITNRVSQFYI